MILNDFIYFNKLYIFCPTIDQEVYELIINKMRFVQKEIEENDDFELLRDGLTEMYGDTSLVEVIDSVKKIPPLADLGIKINSPEFKSFQKTYGFIPQVLCVFDDLVNETDQRVILDYFTRSRHHGISCMYLTQGYFATPPMVRKNCNVFSFFNMSGHEFRLIPQDHPDFSKDTLKEVWLDVSKKRYQFLHLDKTCDPQNSLRINFDEIYSNGQYIKIEEDEDILTKSQTKIKEIIERMRTF
jgi:hypothetical protein